jgi:hypothetical protein
VNKVRAICEMCTSLTLSSQLSALSARTLLTCNNLMTPVLNTLVAHVYSSVEEKHRRPNPSLESIKRRVNRRHSPLQPIKHQIYPLEFGILPLSCHSHLYTNIYHLQMRTSNFINLLALTFAVMISASPIPGLDATVLGDGLDLVTHNVNTASNSRRQIDGDRGTPGLADDLNQVVRNIGVASNSKRQTDSDCVEFIVGSLVVTKRQTDDRGSNGGVFGSEGIIAARRELGDGTGCAIPGNKRQEENNGQFNDGLGVVPGPWTSHDHGGHIQARRQSNSDGGSSDGGSSGGGSNCGGRVTI